LATLLLGGALADRLPRTRLMAASDAVAAGLQAVGVLLLAAGVAPLPSLALLQLGVGASRGFFHPAMTGLVASLVPRHRLQAVNGLLGMALAAARLAGPPAAGLVVAGAGPRPALLAVAATFAVSALLLRGLGRREPANPAVEAGGTTGLRRGLREVAAREPLWLTIVWFALIACAGQAPLLVLGPSIAEHRLGGAAAWGLALGALGAGSAVGGALAATVRVRRPLPLGVLAYALYALPIAALAVPLPAAALVAAAIPGGVASGFFSATWFATFQREVPHETISGASAWDWMGSLAALPLGMLLAGPLAERTSPTTVLTTAAVAVPTLSVAVAVRLSRRAA
jgi:MFS family permease